jgi:KaiC/GvpD/RAD55 family RecA-like ATPase
MRVDEQILIMADLIQQTAAKRIVLDSIPSLVAHIEDILHIREKIFQLIEILRSLKCTSFLISDILSGQMSDKFGTQELVDSVFLLKALKGREARERYLEITKFHAFTKPMGNYVLRINPAGIELLSHPGVTYK